LGVVFEFVAFDVGIEDFVEVFAFLQRSFCPDLAHISFLPRLFDIDPTFFTGPPLFDGAKTW
jgi:hypothetical protein